MSAVFYGLGLSKLSVRNGGELNFEVQGNRVNNKIILPPFCPLAIVPGKDNTPSTFEKVAYFSSIQVWKGN